MKKTTIIAAGLTTLLAGCDSKPNITRVSEEMIVYKAPEGCEELIDFRFEMGHNYIAQYQVLCKEQNGNLALYMRAPDSDSWNKRILEAPKDK